ncbi:MAG: cobalamin-binding protein [Anaerolineales bacterium]|nr:MAG: cobalamin-binding protein [Anaerolineales bacterium]
MTEQEIYDKLAQAVVDGEDEIAVETAKAALVAGLDPLACINNGLTEGMNRVGELFDSGEYYLPDLIIGGEAMKAAMEVLEPALLDDQEREVLGKVVIGTVEGDLHEIGKNLVATLLSVSGFRVTDIGIDKSPADFLNAVIEADADIVGASALLTTTMLVQGQIVEALEDAGLRDKVKVIVGGAPVNQSWADQIGADAYGENAISSVAIAKKLMGL